MNGGYSIIDGIVSNTTEGTQAGLYNKIKNAIDNGKTIVLSNPTVKVSGTSIGTIAQMVPQITVDETNKIMYIGQFMASTKALYFIKVTYNATADKIQTVAIS